MKTDEILEALRRLTARQSISIQIGNFDSEMSLKISDKAQEELRKLLILDLSKALAETH